MNAAGLDHYRRLFGARAAVPKAGRRELDRTSLPSPLAYLTEYAMLTTRPRGEWANVRCPVHKGGDEQHPSMSVSMIDGHFRCHACGAKGHDIIALHRLATGLSFREAVADLGGRFHG